MAERKFDKVVNAKTGVGYIKEIATSDRCDFSLRVLFGDLWEKLSPVQRRIVCHGVTAKLGDIVNTWKPAKKPAEGDPKTPVEAARATWATIQSGLWSGGAGSASSTPILRAMIVSRVMILELYPNISAARAAVTRDSREAFDLYAEASALDSDAADAEYAELEKAADAEAAKAAAEQDAVNASLAAEIKARMAAKPRKGKKAA